MENEITFPSGKRDLAPRLKAAFFFKGENNHIYIQLPNVTQRAPATSQIGSEVPMPAGRLGH